MPIMTGLSGNEIFCLRKKELFPGELVIGNSVYSVGFVGGIASGFKTLVGGEVERITSIIHEGRHASYERMIAWTDLHGAIGISGVSSELIQHGTQVEFLSVGSCVHREKVNATHIEFSASADGQ